MFYADSTIRFDNKRGGDNYNALEEKAEFIVDTLHSFNLNTESQSFRALAML